MIVPNSAEKPVLRQGAMLGWQSASPAQRARGNRKRKARNMMETDHGPEESAAYIDTPEGIEMWGLLSFRALLAIEIRTGLKHSRGSVLAAARRQGLTTQRTKAGAYADINALIVSKGGPDRPLEARVKR